MGDLPMPSTEVWMALCGLALFGTAIAYVVFFEILTRAGAGNVMLVTLLMPVTALLLGKPVPRRTHIRARTGRCGDNWLGAVVYRRPAAPQGDAGHIQAIWPSVAGAEPSTPVPPSPTEPSKGHGWRSPKLPPRRTAPSYLQLRAELKFPWRAPDYRCGRGRLLQVDGPPAHMAACGGKENEIGRCRLGRRRAEDAVRITLCPRVFPRKR